MILEGRREEWDVNANVNAQVERILENFGTFLFSPDGKTLYFSVDAWATSQAAHALDLTTGKERFLVDGWVGSVITKGPYKGMLWVDHLRLDPVHDVDSPKYRGRMPTASIMTPDGQVVREVPEGVRARQKMLDRR
jgi:hypothetical protein